MIDLEDLLDIVCTEAFEHGGVPEVPDHKHGSEPNYHAQKRPARDPDGNTCQNYDETLLPIKYDLELILKGDNTYAWEE